MGLTVLFIDPQKSFKYIFQYKLRSHSIIHTFKNYFITVFSIFSNKWYPNRPFNFNNCTISVHLPSVSATFGFFYPTAPFLWPPNSAKHVYLYIFWSSNIIYTFKNYFIIWVRLDTAENWKVKSENWKTL